MTARAPVAVTAKGNTARFEYGPDGEWAGKSFLAQQRCYVGADAEVPVDGANTAGLPTFDLHPDVRREGQATDIMAMEYPAHGTLVIGQRNICSRHSSSGC